MAHGKRSAKLIMADRMDIADTESRLALQGIGLQPLGFY